jgi:hypothetical protein
MASPFSRTATPPPTERVTRRQARRQRRMRDHRAVLLVIAASAVLGLVAPAAPTGFRFADALWCAAFAAACAWAASRSRRWAWLWSTGLVAAFSLGSWWALAGVAALVLALVGAFLKLRSRVLGALVGALVAQAALRMPSEAFFGFTALIAAIAIVPLLASAYERSPVPIRRRIRRVAIVAGVLAVMAGIAMAIPAILAKPSLDEAVSNSQTGLALIRDGHQSDGGVALANAANDFNKADNLLSGPWSWPARLVPLLAQHRDALATASSSGARIARTGSVAASVAPYQTLKADNGRINLGEVVTMQRPVADTAAALESAQRSLRSARVPWLVGPVAQPLATFSRDVDQALPQAVLARDALAAAPALLGATTDRTYLVLFTNPAETRFLGGFTGSYGLLTAHQGKVSFTVGDHINLLFPDRASAPPLKIVGETDYERRYGRYEPERNLQNLTVSPDMPTDADVTRSLFKQYYGKSLDGIFVVDPYALAALLKLTGPVQLASIELTADNAAQYLVYQQYVNYGNATDDRKDVLSEAGKAVFKALTTRALPGPRSVGDALGPMVAQKRLLFYPYIPSAQKLFGRIGALGQFAPDHGSDYLSLRSANANPNKIDSFLKRSITYDVAYDPGTGNASTTATITLQNTARPNCGPEYLCGNAKDPVNRPQGGPGVVPAGTNTMYLSYYSPLNLISATLNGLPTGIEAQSELGANVYSSDFVVYAGQTATIVLKLEGVIGDSSNYHLQVLTQPLVNPDTLAIRVRSSSPAWHVKSAQGLDVGADSASTLGVINTDHRYSVHFGG